MKPQIPATELQARAEYKFLSFFIVAPRGISVRDLLGAEVWQEIVAHEANINAKLIKPFDLVRVRAEDGTFDVQLTVVARRKMGRRACSSGREDRINRQGNRQWQ